MCSEIEPHLLIRPGKTRDVDGLCAVPRGSKQSEIFFSSRLKTDWDERYVRPSHQEMVCKLSGLSEFIVLTGVQVPCRPDVRGWGLLKV